MPRDTGETVNDPASMQKNAGGCIARQGRFQVRPPMIIHRIYEIFMRRFRPARAAADSRLRRDVLTGG